MSQLKIKLSVINRTLLNTFVDMVMFKEICNSDFIADNKRDAIINDILYILNTYKYLELTYFDSLSATVSGIIISNDISSAGGESITYRIVNNPLGIATVPEGTDLCYIRF